MKFGIVCELHESAIAHCYSEIEMLSFTIHYSLKNDLLRDKGNKEDLPYRIHLFATQTLASPFPFQHDCLLVAWHPGKTLPTVMAMFSVQPGSFES